MPRFCGAAIPKKVKMIEKVASLIGAAGILAIAAMMAWGIAHPTKFECGACGAQVNEVWYVQKMDNSGLVEVCEQCYDEYNEATN